MPAVVVLRTSVSGLDSLWDEKHGYHRCYIQILAAVITDSDIFYKARLICDQDVSNVYRE